LNDKSSLYYIEMKSSLEKSAPSHWNRRQKGISNRELNAMLVFLLILAKALNKAVIDLSDCHHWM
jgi:hypothetical protein